MYVCRHIILSRVLKVIIVDIIPKRKIYHMISLLLKCLGSIYCATVGALTISRYNYREIYDTEFNLPFHTALKDQCDVFCVSYANACDEKKKICFRNIKDI